MFDVFGQLRRASKVSILLLLLWASAFAVAEADAPGVAVIPPGREQLLADMLGMGTELPRCAFAGAQAEHEIVRSRYACPTGEVVIELHHPSKATETATLTERFAIVVASGTSPPELTSTLATRIRERESEFEWTWASGSDPASQPPFYTEITNAGLLTLIALLPVAVLGGLLLVWMNRRTGETGPARSRVFAVAGSSLVALALSACIHAALRTTGRSFAILVKNGPSLTVIADAGLVVLLVIAAAIAAALLLRLASTRALRAWAAFVMIVYVVVGWRLSLPPDDLHYFGGLSTFPPNLQLSESVAGNPPVSYRINRLGFRKPDFDEVKTDGVVRVVLIGDSFVFGTGVDYEGTLPYHLATELQRRFPGRPFEVLNLGIPGNNLSSHVDLYATAIERLNPDVVVLCMILVNDLSRWDEQVARRDARRMSPFSLVRFLAGDAVEPLWALMHLERSMTTAGLEHLDRQLSRLEEIQRRSQAPHVLALFGFSPWETNVARRLQQMSDVVIVPNRTTLPEEFIAGDGHPTSSGNERSAAHIATTLTQLPAWHRLLGASPTPNP